MYCEPFTIFQVAKLHTFRPKLHEIKQKRPESGVTNPAGNKKCNFSQKSNIAKNSSFLKLRNSEIIQGY